MLKLLYQENFENFYYCEHVDQFFKLGLSGKMKIKSVTNLGNL